MTSLPMRSMALEEHRSPRRGGPVPGREERDAGVESKGGGPLGDGREQDLWDRQDVVGEVVFTQHHRGEARRFADGMLDDEPELLALRDASVGVRVGDVITR